MNEIFRAGQEEVQGEHDAQRAAAKAAVVGRTRSRHWTPESRAFFENKIYGYVRVASSMVNGNFSGAYEEDLIDAMEKLARASGILKRTKTLFSDTKIGLRKDFGIYINYDTPRRVLADALKMLIEGPQAITPTRQKYIPINPCLSAKQKKRVTELYPDQSSEFSRTYRS